MAHPGVPLDEAEQLLSRNAGANVQNPPERKQCLQVRRIVADAHIHSALALGRPAPGEGFLFETRHYDAAILGPADGVTIVNPY